MSNEYKDWIWDTAIDTVIERGLLDFVHEALQIKVGIYLSGFKNGEIKAYIANQNHEGQWEFEETMPNAVPDKFELGYIKGWQMAQKYYTQIILELHDTIAELRNANRGW